MTWTHEHSPIRRRREEQGMLLVELAEKLDRCAAFVSNVENGYVPTQHERRKQIADALQTTPEALWPQEYA